MQEVLHLAAHLDRTRPPPALAQLVHRRLREWTGVPDPYRAEKERFNRLALEVLPDLARAVASAPDPLLAALEFSVAANTIDLGVTSSLDPLEVATLLRSAAERPLVGDVEAFRAAWRRGGSILLLADNAGEIVVDRLLVEQLGPARVTVAVRGAPVLNDATREDARAAGLLDLVEVVDNGSDAPGTILEDCSPAFRERFLSADLVLAKGQGNYETLGEAPRPVFCLFKVKCAMVAKFAGLLLGTHALRGVGVGVRLGEA